MDRFVILEISESYSGNPFCDLWRVAIIMDVDGDRIRSANFNSFGPKTTGVILSPDQKTVSSPQYYTNEGKGLNEWIKGDTITCQ